MEHHHSHSGHGAVKLNNIFVLGIILNSGYIVIEVIYGLLVNSMALLADAGHNLSDVLGLFLAWGASYLATKHSTKMRTYGYRKSTILAALFNSILLFVAVGGIGIETIERFFSPKPVEGGAVIVVAGIGTIINAATALLFMKGRENDLNIKGAFLHMAADAAVSLGVVLAGILILYTKMFWIDPLISLVIMAVVIFGTWNLLKDSFNLAMDSVPSQIETHDVEKYLKSFPEVKDIHDLHIWAMSTTETALTVHIEKTGADIDDELTQKISEQLNHKFGIAHTTIQFEVGKKELHCKCTCI
jgi:cation diffusion facilitator family transporter